MGNRRDIAQDDDQELDEELEGEELEEGEEEEEDDEEKPKRKPAASNPGDAKLSKIQATIEQLANTVAASGSKKDQAKVSKVDALFNQLLSNGYEAKDLTLLAAVTQAVKEDLDESYKEKSAQDKKGTLDERCFSNMQHCVEAYEDEYPAVGWAKDRIIGRVRELLVNDERFEGARQAYASGREPSMSDFKKATASIVKTFLKESGIKKSESGSSEQLDLKSSSKKPAKISTKDGDVDLKSLSDFEREIYVSTMNIVKNKEIALDALKAVRGKRY